MQYIYYQTSELEEDLIGGKKKSAANDVTTDDLEEAD